MYHSLLCLTFLTVFFQSVSASVSNDELPFHFSAGYLIQVEGRIGTQAHLKFVIDTGATVSIVDRRIVEKLKVERQMAESFNIDRTIHWDEATIPEIQFGPIQATNVAVLVGHLADYSEFARNVDAIVGLDLLRLRNFTIDLESRRIVFQPQEQEVSLGGEPVSNCLILTLQIQGYPVRVVVDTGFPTLLLYEERLGKSIPALRTVGGTTEVMIGGRLKAKKVVLPDVLLGNAKRDVPVLLVQTPSPNMLPGIDGIVGIALLNARRVHFDFSSKTLSWN